MREGGSERCGGLCANARHYLWLAAAAGAPCGRLWWGGRRAERHRLGRGSDVGLAVAVAVALMHVMEN